MSRLDEIRKFLDDMPEQRKLIAQGYRWGQKYQEDIPYLLSLVERLLDAAEQTVRKPMGIEPHALSDLKRELEGKDD